MTPHPGLTGRVTGLNFSPANPLPDKSSSVSALAVKGPTEWLDNRSLSPVSQKMGASVAWREAFQVTYPAARRLFRSVVTSGLGTA